MVVRTTEPADVSWEPQGPCDRARRALGLLPGLPVLGRASQLEVSKEHGAPVSSQGYRLLTTGRCQAPQSNIERLPLKTPRLRGSRVT